MSKIVNKELCICGKLGAKSCFFKSCKECCKSKLCPKHNILDANDHNNYNLIYCCICKKQDDKLNILYENVYYCDDCRSFHNKLFDKVLNINHNIKVEPDNFIIPMFTITDIEKCLCGNASSKKCFLRCCNQCCEGKSCLKHNVKFNRNKGNKTKTYCNMCWKPNSPNMMNNYWDSNILQNIYYCEPCYAKHQTILNNLIIEFVKPEQYDNFVIKYCETEEEKVTRLIKQNAMKDKEKYKILLEKYKHEVITHHILHGEFFPNENLDLNDLEKSEYKYECVECKNIIAFEDAEHCESCDKFACASCHITKTLHCHIRHCYYCLRGTCDNEEELFYCKECYIDDNEEFYKKYANLVITDDTLEQEQDFLIDLKEFSSKNYNLTYKCARCDNNTTFDEDHIKECDDCDKFVCVDCIIKEYISCGKNNCRFCAQEICWNSETYYYCKDCNDNATDTVSIYDEDVDVDVDVDVDIDEDEDIINIRKRCNSPCELASEDNGMDQCGICYINKKKYACVPCGHLCMCGECANKIEDACPICKMKISNIIKIYI